MTELRPYQAEAVEFIRTRRRVLLALPPGAGKTATVVNALASTPSVLVVAPKSVLGHWKAEYQRWTGRGAVVVTGTKAQRERALASTWPMKVINYEAFRTDIDALLQIPWDAVVFDESHRLKNHKSQTFKAAAKIAKQTEQLVLVTGTPVLNRATELWTSLHLMDPKRYRSYWRWVEERFEINIRRYSRLVREIGKPKPGAHNVIRLELAFRMFYRPLADILPDLPPVIETTVDCFLTAAERKAYETMEQNFWMEVGEEIIQAPNAIAKQTRLRQLASDWSCFGEPAGTKAKLAAELVKDLDGQQCVIFCAFRGTADATAELIPGARAYHGGIPSEQRDRIKEAFIAGEVSTLVATIATLGEGADGLQAASHNVIFIDRDWTPARNEQAVRRLARLGQTRDSVNVTHIVANATIDAVVANALACKADVIRSVIESRAGTPNQKEPSALH